TVLAQTKTNQTRPWKTTTSPMISSTQPPLHLLPHSFHQRWARSRPTHPRQMSQTPLRLLRR
ncbi:hypothetical protein BDY19DRAFT_963109, partial [Irpex rosettiformis]